jgi:hypothetical protein
VRRRILYTLGRPEPELEAIRQLIAQRSGLNADEIYPYDLSAGKDYGRVYYAVVDPTSHRGLIFTISRRSSRTERPEPQHVSEWEVIAFFKLVQNLDPGRVYSMLAPLRLFEDEIKTLA